MRGNLDNSGTLIRFILRRERVMSTIWIAGLLLFSLALAAGMEEAFDDVARNALAVTLNNPGIIAMMGPVYGADNYTVGAMYSNTLLLWVAMAVAVMNIFLVVRHTRADEEQGRAEVVRSLPTGRLANLNAAMWTAVIVNAVLSVLLGLGLTAFGIESMGFGASMLFGVTLGVVGLWFAAIAALFAQLSSSARGALSCSAAALGASYMLRAAGDLRSEALSLISPLGLIQRTQVFVENNWWPVIVVLLEVVVISVAACMLNSIRDVDQGFIPAKPGRKQAPRSLLSSFGLSFRLLRGTLIAWLIILFLLGASYGSVLGDIDTFITESPVYQQLIGVSDDYSTAEMFTTMVNSIAALMCLVPLLTAVLKPRSEEREGRAEHVLSRAVSRTKHMAGYAFLAFVSSVIFQAASAAGLYVAASFTLDEPVTLGFLLKASMVYLPALWIVMGAAILLVGLVPKATNAIWGYLGFSFLVSVVGRIPDIIPAWIANLSPFPHIPQLPVDSINYVTLAVMTGIAIVVTVAGFVFYARRDIQA